MLMSKNPEICFNRCEPSKRDELSVYKLEKIQPRFRCMVSGTDAFRDEIRELEKIKVAPGGVVFYGSSTIRLWDSLEQDLMPLPVYNLGFGGSTLRACEEAFSKLVLPL